MANTIRLFTLQLGPRRNGTERSLLKRKYTYIYTFSFSLRKNKGSGRHKNIFFQTTEFLSVQNSPIEINSADVHSVLHLFSRPGGRRVRRRYYFCSSTVFRTARIPVARVSQEKLKAYRRGDDRPVSYARHARIINTCIHNQ